MVTKMMKQRLTDVEEMEMLPVLKIRKCKICQTQFSSLTDLSRRMRTEHGDKGVKCDLCARTFFPKRGLKDHRKLHSSQTIGGLVNNLNEVEATSNSSSLNLEWNKTKISFFYPNP